MQFMSWLLDLPEKLHFGFLGHIVMPDLPSDEPLAV